MAHGHAFTGNVLFELDGEPALNLYERYLGDEADGLPGTCLLFPLQIQNPDNADHRIVRTILAVDRDERSLTFAGDVPERWRAQLMRGNFDRLSWGAADAARQATEGLADGQDANGVCPAGQLHRPRALMGQRVVRRNRGRRRGARDAVRPARVLFLRRNLAARGFPESASSTIRP
jgi:hypothetical protein